jgi:hypothetical protein
MNNRTNGNNTLRKHLKAFLKKIKPDTTIYTNRVVIELSKLNKNYSLSSQRVTNLLKEQNDIIKFVKSGVWIKL